MPGADLPIPDTLRDAVLLRLDGLPDPALRLLHLAVVAGREFDLALVAELAGSTGGFDALLECGLLVEVEPGRGAFRHALTREAIYGDISWGRRRALHRQMAERLQAAGAAPLAIAQHWLAAKEPDRARAALLAAAAQAGTIHAYRDAADAAQRALELWPDGAEDARRLDVLDHSASHARAVASGMLGSLYVLRGQPRHAQPLLLESMALAHQIELAAMELLGAWGLALLDELNGAYDTVAERCRFILSRWEQIEDGHYAVPALRWAVSFFAMPTLLLMRAPAPMRWHGSPAPVANRRRFLRSPMRLAS